MYSEWREDVLVLYQFSAKTSYRLNWEFGFIARDNQRFFLIQSSFSDKEKCKFAWKLSWIWFIHELKRSLFTADFISLHIQQWGKWRNKLKIEYYLFVIRYYIPSLIWHIISIHITCINKRNSLISERFVAQLNAWLHNYVLNSLQFGV